MTFFLRGFRARTGAVLPVFLLALFLAACSTNRYTGENQLSFGDEQTAKYAVEALTQEQKKYGPSKLANGQKRAEAVVGALVTSAGVGDINWTVQALGGDVFNAWASGGHESGVVAVYDGLQEDLSDDGLGFVLGHEISHVLYRHVGEGTAWAQTAQVGSVLAGVAATLLLGDDPAAASVGQGVASLGAVGTELAVLRPKSRAQETEADRLGAVVASLAGFHPKGAIEVMQKFVEMDSKEGRSIPVFLSTHPMSADRMQNIRQMQPWLMEIYEYSQGGDYPSSSNPLIKGYNLPGLDPKNRNQVLQNAFGKSNRTSSNVHSAPAVSRSARSSGNSSVPRSLAAGKSTRQGAVMAGAVRQNAVLAQAIGLPANGGGYAIVAARFPSRKQAAANHRAISGKFTFLNRFRSGLVKDSQGGWNLAWGSFSSASEARWACGKIGSSCQIHALP